jgi:hypothetical protein
MAAHRPALAMITVGDYAGAQAYLAPIHASGVEILNDRIDDMTATLDWVNAQLPKVR